jgi:hypothetical protein
VATTTHKALCSFKSDLQTRADDLEVYIVELEHRQRPFIPGVTLADLKRTLGNQRMTLSSLTDLECS